MYCPHWDIDPSDLRHEDSVKGILIIREIAIPTREHEDCVLLIRNRGDYYERVGIFWFLPHTIDVWEWENLYTQDDPLWSKHRQRPVYGNDFKGEATGKWWRSLFEEDHIRLG